MDAWLLTVEGSHRDLADTFGVGDRVDLGDPAVGDDETGLRERSMFRHTRATIVAPVREWLPVLANVLAAKPPRRIPRWLARLVAGESAVVMGTESRGASNAKARRELGWTLRYPSWRQGFPVAYGRPNSLQSRA